MTDDKVSTLNLIAAITLSVLVMLGWNIYSSRFEKSNEIAQQNHNKNIENLPHVVKIISRDEALKPSHRIHLENDEINVSLNLKGLQIDDISFKKDNEVFFNPSGTENAYFAEIGVVGSSAPTNNTVWNVKSQTQKSAELFTIHNGARFDVSISLDDLSMFTIKQTSSDANSKPYVRIFRTFKDMPKSNMMLHEGLIAGTSDKITEIDYDDIEENANLNDKKAWVGFSDKYTLASVYGSNLDGARLSHPSQNSFQADVISSFGDETLIFIGKKDMKTLNKYEEKYSIPLFHKAINFGALYFLTKPMSFLLTWLDSLFGNFAIAIVILTLVIKITILPFSIKASISMAKMKSITSKLADIKERHKDNRMLAAQATMQLYKDNKINPLSGFTSILLQIPIFFALYKVLYISVQMHGAPLFLWIKDLSSPDPLSILNLFGLLPWHAANFLSPLAITLGISTFMYQLASPRSVDKSHNTIMKVIPVMMAVFMSNFASGLLLYWIVNNILSSIQQMVIEKFVIRKRV